MTENVNEHRIYFPCPYVRCNWWAAAETELDARRAVAEHCREVHQPDTQGVRAE